jgi:hypothetical protein
MYCIARTTNENVVSFLYCMYAFIVHMMFLVLLCNTAGLLYINFFEWAPWFILTHYQCNGPEETTCTLLYTQP